MLKMHEIREIIKLVDQSSVQEFEMENEGLRISIKKGREGVVLPEQQVVAAAPVIPAPAPVVVSKPAPTVERVREPEVPTQQAAVQEPVVDEALKKIVSPMVGTFYTKPDPNSPSYVKVGDKVNPDSIVCIVEAMKLFNEIEAEVTGEIVKILVTDGQLVEYGQPLFLVK
ncbi:acetyl-CoA carboxylase biotin carboxyl carrier protein [Ammoniphilus sp. CFH 90114]|uniref:acetyl-CoA carboxylase biotin carboxyl carrier protein n=1 Tax=Ammoniphilus sp. CFH 90114 TaxID=2493665 RepID=UPI00100FE3FD|nr:acetyl-CoA carboxylase biotin carboxyl carrier protein [Ammoniphilus sp. CFH 90114]RXT13783.1 acetyl-CoA carboxylase biotin carboxyl carrier protein [Ammoniphilus sp. CFH 90114]